MNKNESVKEIIPSSIESGTRLFIKRDSKVPCVTIGQLELDTDQIEAVVVFEDQIDNLIDILNELKNENSILQIQSYQKAQHT